MCKCVPISTCTNVHKWRCWFLGKAQSLLNHHWGCARHLAPAQATALCTALVTSWVQPSWVRDYNYKAGKQFEVPASCVELYVDHMDRRERKGALVHTTWDLQKAGKHLTSATLTRKGLCLTGVSWGSREMQIQFSHVFSYSISQGTSKGTWAFEDTETLKRFEDSKYLVLKDVFVLKPWWRQNPQRGHWMRPPFSQACSALCLAGLCGRLPLSTSV